MNEQGRLNQHGERITKLETRMDNHEVIAKETKELVKDIQKDQKWQTKQIFMGIGGLAVLYIVLEIYFKLK